MIYPRKTSNMKPLLILFSICFIFRLIETFIIRTDQTIIQENFIHKIIGIMILAFGLKYYSFSWDFIGFKKKLLGHGFILGMILGLITFFISYSIEIIILKINNPSVWLEFYSSGFSITGSTIKNTSIFLIILPIIFNLINSLMEEGIFRGLFIKLSVNKYSFSISNLMQSAFFGLWHIVMTIRSYIDGDLNLYAALFLGFGYIMLSFIVGIKLGLLAKYTGALWAGFFFHTFNNSIVNLLHVVTPTQTDSMQIIRVILAQFLSLFIVWIYGVYKNRSIKNSVATIL